MNVAVIAFLRCNFLIRSCDSFKTSTKWAHASRYSIETWGRGLSWYVWSHLRSSSALDAGTCLLDISKNPISWRWLKTGSPNFTKTEKQNWAFLTSPIHNCSKDVKFDTMVIIIMVCDCSNTLIFSKSLSEIGFFCVQRIMHIKGNSKT